MKVFVIGAGGREHALCWKFKEDGHEVFCAPTNPGIDQLVTPLPSPPKDMTPESLADVAEAVGADLTVVGPEAHLAEGIADYFHSRGLALFGPTKQAAELETSKVFSKEFMARHKVPTAKFISTDRPDEAIEAARSFCRSGFAVIKPDGLTGGKGVTLCHTIEEATETIKSMLDAGQYGEAGKRVIVEEGLVGTEVSVHVLTDGNTLTWLTPAQDHKSLYEEGAGPNTGGLGAFAPTPFLTEKHRRSIQETVVARTVAGLQKDGILFQGVIYFGLMLTKRGPKVLEYNVRFGNPEAQVIIPLIESDLAKTLLACTRGTLAEAMPTLSSGGACTIVLAAKGYPGPCETGQEIVGIEKVSIRHDMLIFHGGTSIKEGKLVTSAGRVLSLTGLGVTLPDAILQAYRATQHITFEGCHFRSDIGRSALETQYGPLPTRGASQASPWSL